MPSVWVAALAAGTAALGSTSWSGGATLCGRYPCWRLLLLAVAPTSGRPYRQQPWQWGSLLWPCNGQPPP
ncbi:hypothetical protein B296_00055739, partial [Ensete ventricosum]